jgi:hypothetical protein
MSHLSNGREHTARRSQFALLSSLASEAVNSTLRYCRFAVFASPKEPTARRSASTALVPLLMADSRADS